MKGSYVNTNRTRACTGFVKPRRRAARPSRGRARVGTGGGRAKLAQLARAEAADDALVEAKQQGFGGLSFFRVD